VDLIEKTKQEIALKHGYRDDILGTAWNYAMYLTHRTKRQIQLYEELSSALAKLSSVPQANDIIPLVSKRYIVREWMIAEVHEFDDYDDAKRKYDKLLDKDAETDIQLYQILDEYSNMDM